MAEFMFLYLEQGLCPGPSIELVLQIESQVTTESCQYPWINYLEPKDLQISDWLQTKVYFLLSHFALIQMVHLSLENNFGFVKNILLLKWILINLLFHIVRNSIWLKKNRGSDNEGKFHSVLMCKIWIYSQKLIS